MLQNQTDFGDDSKSASDEIVVDSENEDDETIETQV